MVVIAMCARNHPHHLPCPVSTDHLEPTLDRRVGKVIKL